MSAHIGEFEQVILLALLRLGRNAYGVTIRKEIEERTRRNISIGAVYTTLERLGRKGYVRSRVGEPTAERGGRRKKFYELQAAGAAALGQAYGAVRRMAEGLEPKLTSKVGGR